MVHWQGHHALRSEALPAARRSQRGVLPSAGCTRDGTRVALVFRCGPWCRRRGPFTVLVRCGVVSKCARALDWLSALPSVLSAFLRRSASPSFTPRHPRQSLLQPSLPTMSPEAAPGDLPGSPAEGPPESLPIGNCVWVSWSWPFPERDTFRQELDTMMEETTAAGMHRNEDLGAYAWVPDKRMPRLPRVRVRFKCWDEDAWEQRGRCLNQIPTGRTHIVVLEITPSDGVSSPTWSCTTRSALGLLSTFTTGDGHCWITFFLEAIYLDRPLSETTGVATYKIAFGS